MNKGGEETTKHGLGGREQKQNVPIIVCACVCLVAPELSLLGGDGEGQEEKEKKLPTCNSCSCLVPQKIHNEDVASASYHGTKGKQKGNK